MMRVFLKSWRFMSPCEIRERGICRGRSFVNLTGLRVNVALWPVEGSFGDDHQAVGRRRHPGGDAEACGEPMRRQNLGGGRMGHEPPAIQEHDLVGEAGSERQVVHDGDDDSARLRMGLQHAQDHQLVARIEGGDRLVDEEHRRARGKRPGEQHAGPFAAGQFGSGAALEPAQPDRRDGCRDRLASSGG